MTREPSSSLPRDSRHRLSSRMARLARKAGQVGRDRRGATAVEYGLILGLITLAMIGAFMGVANSTVAMWNNVNAKVTNAR